MAVKNFVFRESWVGSMVAGMKTTFFIVFDIRNSLNNILAKKGRNYIIINFVTLKLTN